MQNNLIFEGTMSKVLLIGSITLLVFTLFVYHLVPALFSNEHVYLLSFLRERDPSLFLNDWLLNNINNTSGTFFSLLFGPLFMLFDNIIWPTMWLRVILWVALLYSLVKLGKSSSLAPISVLLGITFFILFGHQGIVAGEWLFGGAEQKVLAYIFVFLALDAMLNRRFYLCGIFAGLAFFSHLAVGGWSAVIIGAMLLLRIKKSPKSLIQYSAFSIPIALTTIIIYLSASETSSTLPLTTEIKRSLVLFRNPHHLDPFYFFSDTWLLEMTIKIVVPIAIFAPIVVFSFVKVEQIPQSQRTLLQFLFIAGLIFIIGIIARYFEIYTLLIIYPFRVADLLFPLMFCMLCTDHGLRFINHRLNAFKFSHATQLSILVLFSSIIGILIFYKVLNSSRFEANYSYWKNISQPSNFEKMTSWIKENTELDSVFLAHPCKDSHFWIKTERPMVVNFKIAPTSGSFSQWKQRLIATNGYNEFTKVGFGACSEIDKHFDYLNHEQLQKIVQKYAADFYLIRSERPELEPYLVQQFDDLYLYDLSVFKSKP